MEEMIFFDNAKDSVTKFFEKEFETEFERDKFIRKLKYSKKIKPLHNYVNDI